MALLVVFLRFGQIAIEPILFYRSFVIVLAAPCENMSSVMYGQRRPRSTCASTHSDQAIYCPLTETLVTTECMNKEQRSGRYLVHAQIDLNLCILLMFEGLFSLVCLTDVLLMHHENLAI